MNDSAKSIAELAAMRARGELTAEQFEEAKRLLEPSQTTGSKHSDVTQDPRPTLTSQKKGGCRQFLFWLMMIGGVIFAIGSYSETRKTPEQREQEAKEKSAEEAQKSTEDAEKRRKGFHCLSSWDGSHRDFVDAVSKSLRDPDSFEHSETKITPVNADGQHTVAMTFRAKNGFGGTNIGSALGTVRQSDCSLASWTLVSS